MKKEDSNVKCVIFEGEDVKYRDYNSEIAILINNWIDDKEDIVAYVRSVLYVADQLEIPEHLIETYFNSSRNLLNILEKYERNK